MQNSVFLAISMPVADAHSVICAQIVWSPILCEAPEDRGVGYFYFIFRCNFLPECAYGGPPQHLTEARQTE